MRIALLLLCCTGCAHAQTTTCGLEIYGDYLTGQPGFYTLEVVQTVEDRMLQHMTGTDDKRLNSPQELCKNLRGYSIRSHPDSTFFSFGQRVSGITDCPGDKVVSATPADGKWFHSSLAHELVHVAQKCKARQPSEDGRDSDHANWSMDNIDSALEVVNQEETTP